MLAHRCKYCKHHSWILEKKDGKQAEEVIMCSKRKEPMTYYAYCKINKCEDWESLVVQEKEEPEQPSLFN